METAGFGRKLQVPKRNCQLFSPRRLTACESIFTEVCMEPAVSTQNEGKGANQMANENRIDPSISIEDERDGQEFFDAISTANLGSDIFDILENLDYSSAARIFRAIRKEATQN